MEKQHMKGSAGHDLPWPLTLRAASLADTWTVTSVFITGFQDDGMSQWLYHFPPRDAAPSRARALHYAALFRHADFKRTICTKDNHTFLVQDTQTLEHVAMSNWKFVPPARSDSAQSTPKKQADAFRTQSAYEWLASWAFWVYDHVLDCIPRSVHALFSKRNTHYRNQFRRFAKHVRADFAASIYESDKQKGYWTLTHLAVMPESGGKGIGAYLLRQGMARADEEDRAIYITSTPAGLGLYTRHGFGIERTDTYFEDEPSGGFCWRVLRRAPASAR